MKKRICLALVLLMLLTVGCGTTPPVEPPEATGTGSRETETDSGEKPVTPTGPRNWQLLYNSDATHIEQNDSPYHAGDKNTTLTKGMVRAAVQEAIDAGIDCYSLAPGQCWVPWWPSAYTAEHIRWYTQTFGGSNFSNPYWNYIQVRGNDMIQDCIDICRENDVGFFLSFRLNDAHHVTGNRTPENSNIAFDSEIVVDHPEYQIGFVPSYNRSEVVLDFRHKAVVENRLKLMRELIENYEIDGMELDFTRRYCLFNVDLTTKEERLEIMVGMLREVRQMLDEATARDGRYRDLSVRIPVWNEYWGDMGIDLRAFSEAGVTVFNLTGSYFTVQEGIDLTTVKETVPDRKVFFELHFITAVDYDEAGKRIHRRATVEQLCTTAMIAYDQGADGISLFNFQYYRGDRVSELDRPYTEPPWEVIAMLKDREGLLKQNQHYFIGRTWRDSIYTGWKLPVTLAKNARKDFAVYAVSPQDGWSGNGILTLQAKSAWRGEKMEVTLNGVLLQEVPYAGKPYDNPYTQMIAASDCYRSWRVPVSLLKEGDNRVTVTMTSGVSVTLYFVELTVQP